MLGNTKFNCDKSPKHVAIHLNTDMFHSIASEEGARGGNLPLGMKVSNLG